MTQEDSSANLPCRGKKIWTEEEDKAMVDIIKENAHISWNDLAKRLEIQCGSKKTGKQCRERFRNYTDPKLAKYEWKSHEKTLFIILHRIYDNQWCNMSKYLTHRSDISIKNYYYSVVRKALRHLSSKEVCDNLLEKPIKFYQNYCLLDLLRKEYLPILNGVKPASQCSHREKIIIRLIRERNATDDDITQYLELMCRKFKEYNAGNNFPIQINVNLEKHSLPPDSVSEIQAKTSMCNTPPLSQLIQIKILPGNSALPPIAEKMNLPKLPSIQTSVPVMKRDLKSESPLPCLFPSHIGDSNQIHSFTFPSLEIHETLPITQNSVQQIQYQIPNPTISCFPYMYQPPNYVQRQCFIIPRISYYGQVINEKQGEYANRYCGMEPVTKIRHLY